jgi:hypothetical protein
VEKTYNYGAFMARRRGKCVFCSSHGRLTREDPIPGWVARTLRDMYPGSRGIQVVTTITNGDVILHERTRKFGAADVYKLPVVCEKCNTGWMSQLENRAKQSLKPMIRGIRCGLLFNQQTDIATWVMLKALSFDLIETSQYPTFEPEDYHNFFSVRKPGPLFQAWLGRYEGEANEMIRHYISPVTTGQEHEGLPAESPHAMQFTLIVGSLLIQAVCVNSKTQSYPARITRSEPNPLTIRIWPAARTVDWPPPLRWKPDNLSSLTTPRPDERPLAP